ncbi:MAG: hypothetical protein Q4P20_04745 [Eubacteriales bacterium]|nr:hypothetical protein [Eubacteriales bacterium]
MRQAEKTAILVSFGCWGYPFLEFLWRGWSHWSMALAGGICFGLLGRISDRMHGRHIALRCAAGAAAITSVEFLFGCIFNLGLHMQVWDYSNELFNIAGQVCIRYSAIWFFLSAPLMRIADNLVVMRKPSDEIDALPACKQRRISI